jgi:5'-deoxynucleotidase YfbR-like HD superfamily hydrolase
LSKIRTYSGLLFDVLNPVSSDIRILDIAWGLSGEGRFTNHTYFHYSVARHSLAVCERLKGTPYELGGLLHDASEAYLRDIPRPLKHADFMSGYRRVEETLQNAIYEKYGVILSEEMLAAVHKADEEQLLQEQHLYMVAYPAKMPPGKYPDPYKDTRQDTFETFLKRFTELI